jgi:hypothetical protein
MSSLLSRIGVSLVAVCAVATLAGIASGAPSADGGGGSTPPTTTTPSATSDGNPWHG